MIDSTVELYAQFPIILSDGTIKKTWGYQGFCGGIWDDSLVWDDTKIWLDGSSAVLNCDVQPKSLNEAQLKQWGISTLSQDSKIVFSFEDSQYFIIGNRARVDYDKVFDIRARNEWDAPHFEFILVPVIGA